MTVNSIFTSDDLKAIGVAVDAERAAQNVDLSTFLLDLATDIGLDMDIAGAVTAGSITRSIETSTTIQVTVNDPRRKLLNSGMFGDGTEETFVAIDLKLDSRWYRLCQFDKEGDDLTLTFQDRVVSYLQLKTKPRKVSRGKMTRAEFVYSMMKEVKATNITLETLGQLHKKQKIAKLSTADQNQLSGANGGDSSTGSKDTAGAASLTVKGKKATQDQIKVARNILRACVAMKCRRKVMMAALMTATQESVMTEIGHGDAAGPDSVGPFQQRDGWGPRSKRIDAFESAKLFLVPAMIEDKLHPDEPLWQLCYNVQHCKASLAHEYAKWEKEAQKWCRVLFDGGSIGDGSSADSSYIKPYEFHRGQPDGPLGEDAFACAIRLAEEVQWRFWINGNIAYFCRDQDLFKRDPVMVITEDTQGVDSIDFSNDQHKPVQEMEVTCHADRWFAPPGAVVTVQECGPGSGNWLVAEIDRDIFSTDTTIKLIQPQAVKKEPAPEVVGRSTDDGTGGSSTGDGTAREKVVTAAKNTLSTKTHYNRYSQDGATSLNPIPKTGRTDCSQWVAAIYHTSGLPSPGSNTGEQAAKGKETKNPKPGDLMLQSHDTSSLAAKRATTHHVELYVGEGKTIGHGTPTIDFANVDDFPGHWFVTYDFLDK